jgi:chitin disaccharide deacetylase
MKRLIIKALRQLYRDLYSFLSDKSVQKRLGYKRNTRLLIIHADDLGLSHSENIASIEAMEKGMVNSASLMVPCPGFEEIADYCRKNSDADIGIHLTLAGEWSNYRWKPVLPANEVATIVDPEGYLHQTKEQLIEHGDVDEIEKELHAQMQKAFISGLKPTHIDSHMFTAFSDSHILRKYISLGEKYSLPVLLTHDQPSWVRKIKNAVIVDRLYCAQKSDLKKGLRKYYMGVLKSLKPGLNCILVHIGFDNSEMREIMGDRADFGSAWRQADFDFFTSEECRLLIKQKNIKLITWREISSKLTHKS